MEEGRREMNYIKCKDCGAKIYFGYNCRECTTRIDKQIENMRE